MKRSRGVLLAFLGLLVGAALFVKEKRSMGLLDLGSEPIRILCEAETWTLESLDYERAVASASPGDWNVVGRIDVPAAPEREGFARELRLDPETWMTLDVASCFVPHHGIRATHEGRSAHVLICFMCQHVVLFDGDGRRVRGVLLDGIDAEVMDARFRELGLPTRDRDAAVPVDRR